jgi:hypothetical protein
LVFIKIVSTIRPLQLENSASSTPCAITKTSDFQPSS